MIVQRLSSLLGVNHTESELFELVAITLTREGLSIGYLDLSWQKNQNPSKGRPAEGTTFG